MNSKKISDNTIFSGILILLILAVSPVFAQSPVPEGAQVEKIADGFLFVEGPVWRTDGFIVFSDIQGNTVYKWTEAGGKEAFLSPSGNSNGLAEDLEGRLLLCQHGKRRVARIEDDGTETELVSLYDGKKLNSPNDLVVKSDGSIYFTDPPYGISSNQQELDFCGIYRLTPDGELILLDKTLNKPNGIALSPDETKLYVDDTEVRQVYVWDVEPDFTISNKKLLYTMNGFGSADGMTIDNTGNLYVTGPGAIWIISSDGTLLDKIAVPEEPANVTWGGEEFQTLFITARTGLYRIKVNATGYKTGIKPQTETQLTGFRLYNTYPNPFNPITTISFSLAQEGKVQLQIYNSLGQEVATVFNGFMSAGIHRLKWQASDFNSGTYFCRLQAEARQETVKMTLVK